MVQEPLAAVRELCFALPDVEEKESWSPVFQVRGKSFAQYVDNHHGDQILGLYCKSSLDVQAVLVDTDPERFYRPQFMAHNGWVAMRVDRDVDWGQAAKLIEDGWRRMAPKRLVQVLAPGSLDAIAARLADDEARNPTRIRWPEEHERHGAALLEAVRRHCFALPEVTEKEAWGSPTFRVRDKMFVHFIRNDRSGTTPEIWCKAPPGAQDVLVSSDPETFFRPPYMGPSGWIGVRLHEALDWSMAASLIADAWRCTAPKKLVQQYGS